MRVPLPVLLALAAAAALLLAPGASAKESVRAVLLTPIPLDAAPATELRVAWRLAAVDEGGQAVPFDATGVFVRLLSATGAGAEEALSLDGAHAGGRYEATVVVPEGGIGDVEIGLVGWASDATGTRRSDAIFPLANDPATVAPRPAPALVEPARKSSPSVVAAVVLVVSAVASVGLAALLGVALVRRARQKPAPDALRYR